MFELPTSHKVRNVLNTKKTAAYDKLIAWGEDPIFYLKDGRDISLDGG